MAHLLNREELAWAAGFFDGEGNVTFGSKPSRRKDGTVFKGVMLQVSQAGTASEPPYVLQRFKAAVHDIGSIMGPYIPKRPNHQPMWRYQASGFEGTQTVVAMLWQWLGPIKRAQAKEKLRTWLAQPCYQDGRNCG